MADLTSQIQELGRNGAGLNTLGTTALTEQANTITNDGEIELFFEASGAALTVVISSIPDPYGRSQDITLNVADGTTGRTGLLSRILFGGTVDIDVTGFANCNFAAFRVKRPA